MESFIDLHKTIILGVIEGFDRIIFKGWFDSFFPKGAIARYLGQRGILLKHAKEFFCQESNRIIDHAKQFAQQAGRPYIYLASAHTHASGQSKEDEARKIAEQDGITEGLVCIFSVLEPCDSFKVQGNRKTQRLEIKPYRTKCLHLYWYIIDPVYGWMHVRIQTWAPYTIQIYINGREYLCRQLDRAGIPYQRSDNKILNVDDFEALAQLSEKFNHTEWAKLFPRFAEMVNPLLTDIANSGFGDYWWVTDQAEIATDILFRSREDLDRILEDLIRASIIGFDAHDVMRFLGRKMHPLFEGEVAIDSVCARTPHQAQITHF